MKGQSIVSSAYISSMETYLKPAEMASALCLSPQRLRELSALGVIPCSHTTPGGHRRYSLDDLAQARRTLQAGQAVQGVRGQRAGEDLALDAADNEDLRWELAARLVETSSQEWINGRARLAHLALLIEERPEMSAELRASSAAEAERLATEIKTVGQQLQESVRRAHARKQAAIRARKRANRRSALRGSLLVAPLLIVLAAFMVFTRSGFADSHPGIFLLLFLPAGMVATLLAILGSLFSLSMWREKVTVGQAVDIAESLTAEQVVRYIQHTRDGIDLDRDLFNDADWDFIECQRPVVKQQLKELDYLSIIGVMFSIYDRRRQAVAS